jgi:uncharacterized protein (DUF433 family)
MRLEDFFDFLADDDIRIKGSRIGIETILYEYIYREQTPETIQKHFSSLTLEQIYATILYYLHNRQQVESYISDWLQWGRQAREDQALNPPPVVIRLKAIKAEQQQALTT